MTKFLKLVVFLIIVFSSIWVGGLFWYKSTIANELELIDRQTDAIVVLTGGSQRLTEGLKMLANNFAGRLFISGVGKGVTISDLYSNISKEDSYVFAVDDSLKRRIELGYEASNTRENAIEVSNWVNDKSYNSIRLITSNYHMARSVMEIRKLLPEITIVEHPVIPDNVKLDNWLSYKGSRNLIIEEYNKLLIAAMKLEFQKRMSR